MLLKVDQIIRDNLDVDDPQWGQKSYVSYKIGNNMWLWIYTYTRSLVLDFKVKAGTFEEDQLAQRLQIEADSSIETRSEKLQVSAVKVEARDEVRAIIQLRIRESFDLSSQRFLDFLKDALNAFPS
jgi:hypothetical protein